MCLHLCVLPCVTTHFTNPGHVVCRRTNSMEQSPSWEANWSWATQEISRILWNPKVYHRIHNSPPSVLILSQISSCPPPFHFLKIRFSNILSYMPHSSTWSLFLISPRQTPVDTSPVSHTCYMPCPTHSFWFDHPNDISWEVQIPRYVVFCTPLLSRPSSVQISPSAPHSLTPWAYVIPWMWETKFRTH